MKERLKKMKKSFEVYSKMYGEPWRGKDETRKFDELIVIAEQGYGDTLQFCRLVLLLQAKKLNVRFSAKMH